MTILVAYVPRPEGQAALDKGMEIAKRRNERLVVVNASPGGSKEDTSMADVTDVERVEKLLRDAGLDAEFKQFVRGNNAVEEIQTLVNRLRERNLGILITDHNVRETLQSTDRAYIIHQGRILREGTAAQLVEDPKVREVYLGHSFDAPVGDDAPGGKRPEREWEPPDPDADMR